MRSAIVAAVLLAFTASSSFALERQAPGNSGQQQPTGLGGRMKNPQNERPRQEEKKPPPQQQQQQQSDNSRDKKQDRRERDDR